MMYHVPTYIHNSQHCRYSDNAVAKTVNRFCIEMFLMQFALLFLLLFVGKLINGSERYHMFLLWHISMFVYGVSVFNVFRCFRLKNRYRTKYTTENDHCDSLFNMNINSKRLKLMLEADKALILVLTILFIIIIVVNYEANIM